MKLPLKWEFPDGKVETAESKEDCLKREIREELILAIDVESALTVVERHSPAFLICLYPFRCTWTGGSLTIAEYTQAIWVSYGGLKKIQLGGGGCARCGRIVPYRAGHLLRNVKTQR